MLQKQLPHRLHPPFLVILILRKNVYKTNFTNIKHFTLQNIVSCCDILMYTAQNLTIRLFLCRIKPLVQLRAFKETIPILVIFL